MISRKIQRCLSGAVLITLFTSGGVYGQEKQTTFKSPEAAVHALFAAVQASDTNRMLTILGPDAKDIVMTDDPVADKEGRQRFLQAHREQTTMMLRSDGSVVVGLGKQNWPFPIPLVKEDKVWHFNTAAGHEEVINRRIGRNELNAIRVCEAYVQAQREYYSECRQGDNIVEYAQRFFSEPGKHNGLYWKVNPGEELSPMGPLVAEAEEQGYAPASKAPGGFQGYKFFILKGQGPNAPGGAFEYVINGHMVAGFAIAAYPAHYGETGVMTYMVNQNGIVYLKDLGANSMETVKAMKYDPDATWKKLK